MTIETFHRNPVLCDSNRRDNNINGGNAHPDQNLFLHLVNIVDLSEILKTGLHLTKTEIDGYHQFITIGITTEKDGPSNQMKAS